MDRLPPRIISWSTLRTIVPYTANHHAWVRLMQDGAPTDAMYMSTILAEPPAVGRKAAVVAHTRARHTRPRAAVEKIGRAHV